MIHLEVLKKSTFFSKIPFNFFKKIKWWSFWEISLIQTISTTNLLLLPFPKTFFFRKIHRFLRKKNVLRNRNISVAFYDNFAMFSDFEEFMFFGKTHLIFQKKINFWTFWEFLLFLSHSTANLPNLARFIHFKTIFPKTHLCFEKPQILKILRYLTNSVPFYVEFATFSSF